jgi:hypothetical protein
MSNQLITKTYNDLTFTFRADGYFNMTKAAQCFGKQLQHFWNSPDTLVYMDAVSKTSKSDELVETKRGNGGGTWAHPKLAIFFARWLELEAATPSVQKIPMSFREALLLAAAQQEQLESAQLQISLNAAKVQLAIFSSKNPSGYRK